MSAALIVDNWTRFNGNSAVRTIISGSDHLMLTFHSDYRGEARGFGLTFQPVRVPEVCSSPIPCLNSCSFFSGSYPSFPPCPQCGGWLFAREGNLSSPNFPLFYPPTTNCAWTIQVSFAQNVSNQVFKQLLSVKIQTENPINLSRCLGLPL